MVEQEDGSLLISGQAPINSEVGILLDGRLHDVVSSDNQGRWEYALRLAVGTETTISARMIGEPDAGATLVTPISISMPTATVDATPVPTNAISVTVLLPSLDGSLTDVTVPLSGSAPPFSDVQVVINNRPLATVSADAQGIWQQAVVLNGPYTYDVYARVVGENGSTLGESAVAVLDIGRTNSDVTFAEGDDPCTGDFPPGTFLEDQRYQVAVCETLAQIARRAGVPLQELIDANPQIENPSRIFPGQVIQLP